MPPARPSASELAVIEEQVVNALKKKKCLRILILGSTVEYRSLVHKHSLSCTIVEASKQFYDILSRQHMGFHGDERIILRDWRDMRLDEKFDFILGDNVLNILNKSERRTVLREVSFLIVALS